MEIFQNSLPNSSNDEYSAIPAVVQFRGDKIFLNFMGGEIGRTVMPFSYVLEKEHGRWREFRKALSKEDQQAF